MTFTRLREVERRARMLHRVMSWWDAWSTVIESHRTTDVFRTREVSLLDRRFCIRPNTSDLRCFEKVFVSKEYDLPFETKPRFIIDAGANIGTATTYFNIRYPDARIISIEPEEQNFRILERNCGSLPNVHLIKAALWSSNDLVEISNPLSEAWAYQFSQLKSTKLDTSRAVPTVTMPQILERFDCDRIDLLKIDIEGAECEIFGSHYSQWLSKVGVLAIELHDRIRPGCSEAMYKAIVNHRFHQEVRGENVFIRFC